MKGKRPPPNYEEVFKEMKSKGATLQVLHNEYLLEFPNGISYPSFCQNYRKHKSH